MRKFQKFMGLLCAACMIMAMSVPTLATDMDRSVTSSTEVTLASDTQKIFDFPVARGYGYWKIAIQNNSSADCWFAITKDSPSGDVVYTSAKVNANSSLSFYCSSDSPLADGTYYVTVHSAKGSVDLDGTLWYKFGTTFDDIAD